ncbi:MAG TPA: VWA domain-containing protein, partial [Phycisphaerae bacterium]|nr:VWA domain-containing protein [Phycisphaerae bacterium]
MNFAGIPLWAVATIAAGSAAILGVLHLLRVRPRQMRVVTTLFWAHAMERSQARTLLEHFRHPLTYALLLLICVLIALALGQPTLSSGSGESTWRVVILDAGASMSADQGGSTRLDLAMAAVRSEINSMPSGDSLAVIVANPSPQVIRRFDDPLVELPKLLDAVKPADQPGDCGASIALARSLLEGRDQGQVILVTDRPIEIAEENLRIISVGEPTDNAAVLSALFIPDGDNRLRGNFNVRVGWWGQSAGDIGIRIQNPDGEILLEKTSTIAPGHTA